MCKENAPLSVYLYLVALKHPKYTTDEGFFQPPELPFFVGVAYVFRSFRPGSYY